MSFLHEARHSELSIGGGAITLRLSSYVMAPHAKSDKAAIIDSMQRQVPTAMRFRTGGTQCEQRLFTDVSDMEHTSSGCTLRARPCIVVLTFEALNSTWVC